MTYRITKARLAGRFKALADLLGWDTTGPCWTPREGGGNQAKVGYTFLEYNSCYGWAISRMVSDSGGESRLKDSCDAKEMDAWLGGALFAAYEFQKRGLAVGVTDAEWKRFFEVTR